MLRTNRFPGDLLWIIGWCLVVGALSLFMAVIALRPADQALYGVMGGLYLTAAVGLYRLKSWGRVTAGTMLLLGAALSLLAYAKGFTLGRLGRTALSSYWGVYLFLPSTRRLFQGPVGPRLTRSGCISQLFIVVPLVFLIAPAIVFKWPSWWVITATLGFVVAYATLVETRVNRWCTARFARRPADIDPAVWDALRAAQLARIRGDFEGAQRLVAPLPMGPLVQLMYGHIIMDYALRSNGLNRALHDAHWIAPPAACAALVEECRTKDLTALVQMRTALVDGLLEDEANPSSLCADEADDRLQKITGRIYLSNAVAQQRESWARRRPRCSGESALTWLTVRLWDAQALAAAQEVAGRAGDAALLQIAQLSVRLDQMFRGSAQDDWGIEEFLGLCLLPIPADAARILLLDSPYLAIVGAERVAARLAARLEFVERLRRLRDDYPEDSAIEIPWLLALLTGYDGKRSRARFELWWETQRAAQLQFDGDFIAGLDAARREEWASAEERFAEAARAWPRRTCAPYNRAVALMRLDRHGEAEEIFARLAEAEPKEAVFWMRTGDARRLAGRAAGALEAYRKAAQVGGLEKEVAVRLGVALASAGREDEAERELDAITAKGFDADRLEELAAFLESEGVYRLAARYREQAFRERLGAKDAEEEDDADAGPVA